jgi:uncharacterized protein DUF998
MVLLQGAGAILIAVGLGQETDAQALGWLYVYGVVRVLISGSMTDRQPEGMSSLTRTGRIHMLLAGTAFASIAVAASHLDWTGKPDVLGPLGWLVTATAIATGAALVVPSIRRVAFGLIERLHYAGAIVWLIVVAGSLLWRRTGDHLPTGGAKPSLSRCGASPGARAGRRGTRRDPCCA